MLMYFSAILVLPVQIVLENRLHLCNKIMIFCIILLNLNINEI